MSKRRDPARTIMRCGTGHHADQAGARFRQEFQNSATAQLLLQNNRTTGINAMKLKTDLAGSTPSVVIVMWKAPSLCRLQTAPAWHIAMPPGWSRPLCRAKFALLGKSGGACQLKCVSAGERSSLVEVVADGGMNGGEFRMRRKRSIVIDNPPEIASLAIDLCEHRSKPVPPISRRFVADIDARFKRSYSDNAPMGADVRQLFVAYPLDILQKVGLSETSRPPRS